MPEGAGERASLWVKLKGNGTATPGADSHHIFCSSVLYSDISQSLHSSAACSIVVSHHINFKCSTSHRVTARINTSRHTVSNCSTPCHATPCHCTPHHTVPCPAAASAPALAPCHGPCPCPRPCPCPAMPSR